MANLIILEIANIKNYLNILIQNVQQGVSCINIFEHGNIFLKQEYWAIIAISLEGYSQHDPLKP